MLKKLFAILMSLAILSSLPITAAAASDEEEQRIRDQIESVYWKTLSSSGKNSLHGYCGVMAGWELYHLGVTETAVTHNGNEMYDLLSVSNKISEGYSAELYPASKYTIEEALNTITSFGTRDAYNIMVGFQWTSTAAGSIYGHVMVIHAVLDGEVYFTEGFTTPFNANPSQAMVCTIPEFAAYYNSWASFEGMIHFGNGGRVAGCDTYYCDLFVASETPVTLLTYPDFAEAEEVRTVAAGERLHATALCQNYEGVLFYRVEENGREYFVTADPMKPVWFVYDELTVTDLVLPEHVDKGDSFSLSGVIRSANTIYNAVVEITDEKGTVVLCAEMLKQSNMVDLSTRSVRTRADISNLADGNYTYSVYCDIINHYSTGGMISENMKRVLVGSSSFTVGDAVPASMSKSAMPAAVKTRTSANGWQYENGNWYYYENGTCRTGWFCYEGIDYYFLEDGSAATGWQNINGKDRYFSETGAMRTGWLETDQGTYYMLSNGVPATGLTAVGESRYFFGEDGKMLTDTTTELDGQSYSIAPTGIVTPNQ